MRPTRDYVPAAPAFTPPSKLGSTVPTDDPMKSSTSQQLPRIPTSLKQKAEPFFPKQTAPQSVRYISSIAQMLPSPEPCTPDIPRSNETGMITVHNDICCGNEDCIVYPVTTWPSSVLAYDDEMLYKELPATEPPFSSLTIEAPDYSFVFEVAASYADFVTVLDVLEAIYQNRNHFDKRWFHGLYWAGDRLCLQLHLTDAD